MPLPEIPIIAPPPTDMIPGYEGAFLKMFLALIGLVVAIFVTVWILKRLAGGGGSMVRWGHGNNNRTMKILEKRPLSSKTMLYILEIDGKQLVVAESQLEVKPLLTLSDITEEVKE